MSCSCSLPLAAVRREKWLNRSVSNQDTMTFLPKNGDSLSEKVLSFDAGMMNMPIAFHDPS